MNTVGTSTLLSSSEEPPADYDRPPTYHGMVRETDVHVNHYATTRSDSIMEIKQPTRRIVTGHDAQCKAVAHRNARLFLGRKQ